MPKRFHVETPERFNFSHTIRSHGWSDLRPFRVSDDRRVVEYTFGPAAAGRAISIRMFDEGGRVRVDLSEPIAKTAMLERSVRHMLRLDQPLDDFYRRVAGSDSLAWVERHGVGRLLRAPTVFEDLVKTLCTTNCSWSLTRKMVDNIVEKLGMATASGDRSFPTAAEMAVCGERFFRDEIRAGYRSRYFAELAQRAASGGVDCESWADDRIPTAELKKQLKALPGFGDYAAENMLKLLGRYDGLALDSWLRARFYERHNRGRKCADGRIERHYAKFGEWRGLAIWCEMTEKWFDYNR